MWGSHIIIGIIYVLKPKLSELQEKCVELTLGTPIRSGRALLWRR